MTTTTKLVCPECRRENERERIYCHDCGARLDRSGLMKEKSNEEDPKATQRRLNSMFDPRRARLQQNFFLVSKVLLGALVLAAIVQIVRPPDLPPTAASSTGVLPAQINLDLENASMDPRAASLRYSEEQVNAYLAYALKSKQAALSKYLQFDRLIVAFDEGLCEVTAQRSLFGVPLFTTTSFAPRLENGALVATTREGFIGRLPIHPLLMQNCAFLFGDVRAALERERKSLVKLGAIALHPQSIEITAKPPRT